MRTTRRTTGRAVGQRGEQYDTLYHVTLARNLSSIAESGLIPSRGMEEGVGRGHYSTWSRGKVFLGAPRSVHYWHRAYECRANDEADNMLEQQSVPVVLRVRNLRRLLQTDTVAASEGAKGAYFVRRPIPARQIEAFDGKQWVPVTRFQDDETVEAYVLDHVESVDDIDGESYTTLRDRIVFDKSGPRKIPSTIPVELYPT